MVANENQAVGALRHARTLASLMTQFNAPVVMPSSDEGKSVPPGLRGDGEEDDGLPIQRRFDAATPPVAPESHHQRAASARLPDSAPLFGLCAITEQTRAPARFLRVSEGQGTNPKKRWVKARRVLALVGATRTIPPLP